MYTCVCSTFCVCIILCKCLTGIADLIGSSWSDRLHHTAAHTGTSSLSASGRNSTGLLPPDLGTRLLPALSNQTKLYAEQRQRVKPDRRWYPTTPEEIRAFIGIIIMMGIDRSQRCTTTGPLTRSLATQGYSQCFQGTALNPSHPTSTSRTPHRCHLGRPRLRSPLLHTYFSPI